MGWFCLFDSCVSGRVVSGGQVPRRIQRMRSRSGSFSGIRQRTWSRHSISSNEPSRQLHQASSVSSQDARSSASHVQRTCSQSGHLRRPATAVVSLIVDDWPTWVYIGVDSSRRYYVFDWRTSAISQCRRGAVQPRRVSWFYCAAVDDWPHVRLSAVSNSHQWRPAVSDDARRWWVFVIQANSVADYRWPM